MVQTRSHDGRLYTTDEQEMPKENKSVTSVLNTTMQVEMLPVSEVLGVTEATGICGMEAEEKEEYEDAHDVIGDEEEVIGEFFSRLGEFSQALRADSICTGDRKTSALRNH